MVAPVLIGKGETQVHLLPRMANRHGLIAGATGTGKTVTLQVLAEAFSRIGVPVFMADVKGDLSGISQPGREHPRVAERIDFIGIEEHPFEGAPVTFWDVFGKKGHPARTTVSELGPTLLARLLDLNDTQEGVLSLVFRVADDNGWLLLDLKDLRAILKFVADNRGEFTTLYGNVSPASVGAIQRRLIGLEDQGAKKLFGEPALSLDHLMQTDDDGRGRVNILAADKLMNSPKMYSTFLLWLTSEFFEELPEVGDQERPRLVLFLDEAHLIFKDCPDVLMDKIEQVVRLIRSKGVGVYFVTQSPLDIPDTVLGQLGNRVQHALRAFTPKDKKVVRAAADTFRSNPKLDTASVITQLKVGEALVSTLDAKGQPSMVERVLIAPPRSQIGPIKPAQRRALIEDSTIFGMYEAAVDRYSAYEVLAARAEQAAAPSAEPKTRRAATRTQRASSRARARPRRSRESVVEAFAKSAVRAIGSQVGRRLIRGLLGSLLRGKR